MQTQIKTVFLVDGDILYAGHGANLSRTSRQAPAPFLLLLHFIVSLHREEHWEFGMIYINKIALNL